MINLIERVSQVVRNSPESAIALYDVLLFMGTPNAALSPEYDEAKELLYAMTQDSQHHREDYEEVRAA